MGSRRADRSTRRLASSTPTAASSSPGSRTRTSTRCTAGFELLPLRPARPPDVAEYVARSPRTRPRTPTRTGSPAAAGPWRRSRAGRRARRRWTPSSPTGRCSCRTATATAPGSTRRRWSSPASTRDTPDPADGRIERDADGAPTGTLHEGAMDLVGAWSRRRPRPSIEAASCAAQRLPARARHHGLAGRVGDAGTTLDAYLALAADAARSPPAWSARCGGTASRGLEQIDELVERRASAGRRPVAGRHA